MFVLRLGLLVALSLSMACSSGEKTSGSGSATTTKSGKSAGESSTPPPGVSVITPKETGIDDATMMSICGDYPNCQGSVCNGKHQRCGCKEDDSSRTCKVYSCWNDNNSP